MDKYEYKIRSEEIKSLIAKGEYVEAASIADTIDWRRVKSVMMLCTISDLYKINRRLEDAKEMLLLAYDRHPGGRSIVYSLCEISIKMGEIVEALGYYKEFVQVAPKDSGRYVLKYKIFEAQEVTLEERIEVLEELKSKDYSEKWAYELAYLYHRVGLETKCVEECDELILWFGDGKYVRKALELKQLHEPLSPEQQEKFDRMKMPAEKVPGQEAAEISTYAEEEPDLMNAPTREIPQKDLDIQVKVMNVGQYDTINMQRALAENMKEIWEGADRDAGSRPLAEDNLESGEQEPEASDTGMFDLPDEEDEEMEEGETEVFAGEINAAGETKIEEVFFGETKVEEVFFGETGEINTDTTGNRVLEEMKMEAREEKKEDAGAPMTAPTEAAAEPYGETTEGVSEEVSEEIPADTSKAEPAQESSTKAPIINYFAGRPSKFDNILGMEYDGQLNMVMPDSEQVEKQITGQLQLEDVLLEWEKIKKNNEQKRMEAVRQHVLEQTGPMFTEFDAAAKDGLLEQLESSDIDSGADEDVSQEASGELEVLEGEEAEALLDESTDTEIEEELEEIGEEAEAEKTELTETAEAEESADKVVEEAATGETAEEEAVGEGPEEKINEEEGRESGEEAVEEESGKEEPGEQGEELAEEAATEVVAEEKAVGEGPEEKINEKEGRESGEEAAEEKGGEPKEEIAAEKDGGKETEEAEEESEKKADAKADEKEVVELPSEESPETKEDAAKSGKPAEKQNTKAKESEGERNSKVRELSEEEKQLFSAYIQSRKTREQIVHAIDNVSMAAYTGNVIITGGEGADTLALAKTLIKEIQQTDSNFSGKIAKISGEALNKKEIDPILDRLKNGALIVQNGGELNEETVRRLRNALEKEHNGLIILLEGTKKAVNKLLKANEGLAECFNIRIDIEELDNDSLVEYGKKYAREQEYSIDDFGMLALHTRIAERQTSDHAVTVGEVKELVDGAIARANRKSFNHFIDILMAKRYDEEDMIVLREKDFM